MGFNLSIGELEHYIDDEGKKRTTVNVVKQPDAPADDSPTDYTNKRWPSYTGWGEFCDYIEVDESVFIGKHPGFKKITSKFKAIVDEAYNKFYGKSEQDGRLAWLKYWTDWAIENCENPVLHNT